MVQVQQRHSFTQLKVVTVGQCYLHLLFVFDLNRCFCGSWDDVIGSCQYHVCSLLLFFIILILILFIGGIVCALVFFIMDPFVSLINEVINF